MWFWLAFASQMESFCAHNAALCESIRMLLFIICILTDCCFWLVVFTSNSLVKCKTSLYWLIIWVRINKVLDSDVDGYFTVPPHCLLLKFKLALTCLSHTGNQVWNYNYMDLLRLQNLIMGKNVGFRNYNWRRLHQQIGMNKTLQVW